MPIMQPRRAALTRFKSLLLTVVVSLALFPAAGGSIAATTPVPSQGESTCISGIWEVTDLG